MTRPTRLSVGVAAIGLVVTIAGGALCSCSVPLPSAFACGQATDATLRVLQSRLTADGTLRNGKTIAPAANGWTVISAELHKQGDKTDARGDILTWASPPRSSGGEGGFYAVDSKARSDSSWPRAPFRVTAPGVIKSRGCVEAVRGTVPCANTGQVVAAIGVRAKQHCDTTTTSQSP